MKTAKDSWTVAIGLTMMTFLLASCASDPQKAKAKYLDLGQKYMKQGQYGDAAIEFRNALRLDPRFVDAYYELAQADLAQHDWRAAYASLEKAIDLDPSRLDARLDRGRLYLATRQFSEAEDEATFVLRQQSDDVAAYQLLGAALIGEHKSDEALAAFTKITTLRPNDPRAYVNLALVEIGVRSFGPAEEHLKKAVEVDPRSTPAYIDLSNFYRLQNRPVDAQQTLQNGIANNPKETSLYVNWASLSASQGKNDDAEAILDRLRKQALNSPDAAIAIGDFYAGRNEISQALTEYRRGLSIAPKNRNIQKRLEEVYLSTGQTQLAADLDQELVKNSGADVDVAVNHGRVLMAQQKTSDAIITLQKVTRDAADSAEAHYYLAMAYWQNGDPGQANGALLDSLRASPGSPMALQALVRLRLSQNDPAGAQGYSQELVRQFPSNYAYRQLIAESFARRGDIRDAEAQLLVAEQLEPKDPVVHLDLASIDATEKKWQDSAHELETALQLDPHSTVALAQFADFFVSRGQSNLAFQRVQQYVTANPNDAKGHFILGTVNFKSKDYAAAQAELEQAVRIDPTNVEANVELGKVLEVEGRADLAIAYYEKALQLQPKSAPIPTEIGNIYLARNDLDSARQYYQRALDTDPNHAVALANMAWVDAVESKDLGVALGRAQKAASEMPDVPSITDTLAWVMYKRGSYSSAIPLLKECIRKEPSSAEYRYHLGMALVAAGQKDEGNVQLHAALQANQLTATEAEEARQTLAGNE